jgi:hypothetical protein
LGTICKRPLLLLVGLSHHCINNSLTETEALPTQSLDLGPDGRQ